MSSPLVFFFLQGRRRWPDELLAGVLLAVQRRGVEQSARKAECLPGDAESGGEFIGLSLRDVPSSGFSDSLSDLNTLQFSPHAGPTQSPNICWLKSEVLRIMYYMAGNEEGF